MATRGRPFQPGNRVGRGRPLGSRNKTTKAAQELLEKHAEPIVRKAVLMALQGETPMMRALLDRLLPNRREPAIRLGSLPVATMDDLFKASEWICKRAAAGQLTLAAAAGFSDLFEGRRKMIETEQLAHRIQALEERT